MALILKADGTRKKVQPINGNDFELEELQSFVGGIIDIINLNNGKILVINDEGKLCGLQPNLNATIVAWMQEVIPQNDYIAGDVLLCNDEEVL